MIQKLKIYAYEDLFKMRRKKLLDKRMTWKKINEWEKSQKFVKLEDYEKLEELIAEMKNKDIINGLKSALEDVKKGRYTILTKNKKGKIITIKPNKTIILNLKKILK